MSYLFKLFSNDTKTKSIDKKNTTTNDVVPGMDLDILTSGLPIMSKDGYFWDMHKHDKSMEMIHEFLPHNHEHMCHLELYNYLKTSGIINHVCIDNFVVKYVKKHPGKTKLFLDMAHAASKFTHSSGNRRNVYEPSTLVEPENVYNSLVRNNIDGLVDGITSGKFETDKDIVDKLGYLVYQHIKYHLTQFEKVDMIEVTSQFTDYSSGIQHIYEILYPEKTKHSGEYLFHGSAYHNWYSIMLNGLKVPKTSSDVINGQAHGMAIYTGIHASTSFQYCTGMSHNYGYMIMGIVQTSNSPNYTSNTMKTYVKDDDVTLRYLIVTKRNQTSTLVVSSINEITKKFPKQQHNVKEDDKLFQINEIDVSNVIKFGENFEEVDDRPYIELEDGTRLYDQPDLVETYTQPKVKEEDDMEINDIERYIVRKNRVNLYPFASQYYQKLKARQSILV
jgi:hypothetical protein